PSRGCRCTSGRDSTQINPSDCSCFDILLNATADANDTRKCPTKAHDDGYLIKRQTQQAGTSKLQHVPGRPSLRPWLLSAAAAVPSATPSHALADHLLARAISRVGHGNGMPLNCIQQLPERLGLQPLGRLDVVLLLIKITPRT